MAEKETKRLDRDVIDFIVSARNEQNCRYDAVNLKTDLGRRGIIDSTNGNAIAETVTLDGKTMSGEEAITRLYPEYRELAEFTATNPGTMTGEKERLSGAVGNEITEKRIENLRCNCPDAYFSNTMLDRSLYDHNIIDGAGQITKVVKLDGEVMTGKDALRKLYPEYDEVMQQHEEFEKQEFNVLKAGAKLPKINFKDNIRKNFDRLAYALGQNTEGGKGPTATEQATVYGYQMIAEDLREHHALEETTDFLETMIEYDWNPGSVMPGYEKNIAELELTGYLKSVRRATEAEFTAKPEKKSERQTGQTRETELEPG